MGEKSVQSGTGQASRTSGPGRPTRFTRTQVQAGAIGCGILILLIAAAVFLIVRRLPTYLQFSLENSLAQISRQVDHEHTLSPQEHLELQIYVLSMREFVRLSDNRRPENLNRFRAVRDVVESALEDRAVGRSELMVIREAMRRSGIPIARPILPTAVVPPTPVTRSGPAKKLVRE